jgi:hypothetical protein
MGHLRLFARNPHFNATLIRKRPTMLLLGPFQASMLLVGPFQASMEQRSGVIRHCLRFCAI